MALENYLSQGFSKIWRLRPLRKKTPRGAAWDLQPQAAGITAGALASAGDQEAEPTEDSEAGQSAR